MCGAWEEVTEATKITTNTKTVSATRMLMRVLLFLYQGFLLCLRFLLLVDTSEPMVELETEFVTVSHSLKLY